jgi:hypothetical protein
MRLCNNKGWPQLFQEVTAVPYCDYTRVELCYGQAAARVSSYEAIWEVAVEASC